MTAIFVPRPTKTDPLTTCRAFAVRRRTNTIEGITVELIGAVQKRGLEDSWEVPTDPAEHRRFVRLGDLQIPVLSLEYEAVAYAELGRHERAELLRHHAAATNIQT